MKTQTTETLESLGFSLSVLSGPVGMVKDDWVCVAYRIRVSYLGNTVIETDYHMVVGCVDPKRAIIGSMMNRFTVEEESLLYTWQSKPYAQFKDKSLHATVAGKLAAQRKVATELDSVVHSLLTDGAAYLDSMSFEDWCWEFGYDSDSIKAKAIYDQCDTTGRAFKRLVPHEALESAREALADF